jgi:hypothetical protein
MSAALGSVVDLLHALLMVAWVAGLPLLFWRRCPWLSRLYAVYAVVFIVLNQSSQLFLGECFLTTLSRYLWQRGGAPPRSAPGEWFTVRVALAVFHATPSHRSIKILSEVLIFITAVGMLMSTRRAEGARPGSHLARQGRAILGGGAAEAESRVESTERTQPPKPC